jgi:uncharacterized protein (TIGR03437 family)
LRTASNVIAIPKELPHMPGDPPPAIESNHLESNHLESHHRAPKGHSMILAAIRFILIGAAAALSVVGQSANPNIILGAGYRVPIVSVAPGQIITIFAAGVGSTLAQPVYAGPGKLPTTLAGISVTIQQGDNIPAPILSVNSAPQCPTCSVIAVITIQVPYELITPHCVASEVMCTTVPTSFFVTENGVAGVPSLLNLMADQVHILTVCDSVLPGPLRYFLIGSCQPEVTHANGTLVSNTNPATAGEELVAYAVGLGATKPAVPTGAPAAEPVPTAQTFGLDFNFHPDALASKPFPSNVLPNNYTLPIPLFAGLTAGYVGLYQINFVVPKVPAGSPPCVAGQGPGLVSTNLTVSIGGSASFDGAAICVSLPE